jgi:hypothetical protein
MDPKQTVYPRFATVAEASYTGGTRSWLIDSRIVDMNQSKRY